MNSRNIPKKQDLSPEPQHNSAGTETSNVRETGKAQNQMPKAQNHRRETNGERQEEGKEEVKREEGKQEETEGKADEGKERKREAEGKGEVNRERKEDRKEDRQPEMETKTSNKEAPRQKEHEAPRQKEPESRKEAEKRARDKEGEKPKTEPEAKPDAEVRSENDARPDVSSDLREMFPEPRTAGPSGIDKQLLSKLNRSLKEKQRSGKENQKTPTTIQDLVAKPSAPNGTSHNETPLSSENGEDGEDSRPDTDARPKPRGRRVAKQSSTRTDFFAAKLASAVDDVASSDSDETFVYESTDFGRDGDTENINHVPHSVQLVHDTISVGSVTPMESGANSPREDSFRERRPEMHKEPTRDSIRVKARRDEREKEKEREREKDKDREAADTRDAREARDVSREAKGVRDGESGDGREGDEAKDRDTRERDSNPKDREDSDSSRTRESKSRDQTVSRDVARDSIRAESVHSQSSKWNLRNTFGAGTPTRDFANPFFEAPRARKSSANSLYSDDKPRSPELRAMYGGPHVPGAAGPVSGGVAASGGVSGVSGGVSGVSGMSGSHSGIVVPGPEAASVGSAYLFDDSSESIQSENSELEEEKKTKNSKTPSSSKLRSTTSKLFDKTGTQPRRYSTIPDDIDIEDFDDELIYYDNNNIRFPHYGQPGSSTNDTASLLGNAKIPHYRSLNFNGRRLPSYPKKKRYLSAGYPTSTLKKNVFPNEHSLYYDLDEYDEEAADKSPVRAPQLAPLNNLSLPHKVSQTSLRRGRLGCLRSFIYTLVSFVCILSIGFFMGFLLASTKDLSNISVVSIENALVSQDELVFSIVVEALNPGWFSVSINDLELDVFAKSGYLGDASDFGVETVLLGSVYNFESEITFKGSFLSRELMQQTGEIKLVAPGRNLTSMVVAETKPPHHLPGEGDAPDNSEKWNTISKHPFDLILRGVLKYNLPMTSSVKSAVVNKVGYIDPSFPSISREE